MRTPAPTEADKQRWGREFFICQVREIGQLYDIGFNESGGPLLAGQFFSLDKSRMKGFPAPQVGDKIRFQGPGLGYPVYGIEINSQLIFSYNSEPQEPTPQVAGPRKFVVEVDNVPLGTTHVEHTSEHISTAIRYIADRIALFEVTAPPELEMAHPVVFDFVAVDGEQRTVLGQLRLRQE